MNIWNAFFQEPVQETVQERLRRETPSLFGPHLNADVIAWRDDPRWNDPHFRYMQVARSHRGEISGPESYFVLVYCKKEGRQFYKGVSNPFLGGSMIPEEPSAFWIKFVETAIKVNKFVEDVNRSHRRAFCTPFSDSFDNPLSRSLIERIVKIIILLSPLVLISKVFVSCRSYCSRETAPSDRGAREMVEEN